MRLTSPAVDRQALFGRAMLAVLGRRDFERATLFAKAFLVAGGVSQPLRAWPAAPSP